MANNRPVNDIGLPEDQPSNPIHHDNNRQVPQINVED